MDNSLKIQELLNKLLLVKGQKPNKLVDLSQQQIRLVIQEARPIILQQEVLVELDPPIKICGDIHGQYYDLLRIFNFNGYPDQTTYLFLGDYVDRGRMGIETITLLLCYKVLFPKKIFLLRGNHECSSINRMYGFFDQCKKRYSVKIWKSFCQLFNCFPLTALIGNSIFCMHGGLSPMLTDIEQLRKIERPIEIPEAGMLCDILWSDPQQNNEGWMDNQRGVSYIFNSNIVKSFVTSQNLQLICRAHQVVEDGYEFFSNRRLVTIFSAPNYCGEFDNCAGVMTVDEEMMCSFVILRPSKNFHEFQGKPPLKERLKN